MTCNKKNLEFSKQKLITKPPFLPIKPVARPLDLTSKKI